MRNTEGRSKSIQKSRLKNRHDLSLAYTPGVGAVSKEIAKDLKLAWKYTLKANTIAIVSDGSRVLSLGNIGGYAAIPVMEGKALLFKKLAGIDAFPICFESYHTEFADDVKNIAPVFGGIALEDIAAPKCFELEEALQGIGIPVMHDDQHGTAVVVLAALLNACRVTKKRFEDLNIVICGAGAAGFAITRMLRHIGYDPGSLQVSMILSSVIPRGSFTGTARGCTRTSTSLSSGMRPTGAGGGARLPMRWKGRMSDRCLGARYSDTCMIRSMDRRPDHFCAGKPDARNPAKRRIARRGGRYRHGTQRLPQPDQLRSRLPGHLPGRT